MDISKLTETEIEGSFIGRPVSGFETQIKAATFHDLEVKELDDGSWEATLIFDV